MKKGIILIIIACLIAVFFISRDRFPLLGKEYVKIEQHPGVLGGDSSQKIVAEVANYGELTTAYMDMIRDYTQSGIIRFAPDYTGVPVTDAVEACSEIEYGSALGIFAVYYMSASVAQNGNFTEAEVTILYNKSIRQVKELSNADTKDDLERVITTCIEDSSTYISVSTSLAGLSSEYIDELVANIYYGNPSLTVALPVTSTSVYSGSDHTSIIEINFANAYPVNTLSDMNDELINECAKESSQLSSTIDGDWLIEVYTAFSEDITAIPDDSETASIDRTAYGALINKKATSEGIAMAYKLLCDHKGIDCYVVRGVRSGMVHYWNIVKVEDSFYHMDISTANAYGLVRMMLKTDSAIKGWYSWDNKKYPRCNGTLTFYNFAPYNSDN